MKNKQIIADFLLFLTAAIWGLTFTIVKNALNDISPYTFNSLRFLLAGLVMALFAGRELKHLKKNILSAGLIIGLFLFGGYTFQTIGLKYTSASNSGFISGLYVIFVPIIMFFISKKLPAIMTMISIILATAGLYFLSIESNISNLNFGDLLTIICALFFAFYVISVSIFAPQHNTTVLVTIQIFVVALVSGLMAVITEPIPIELTTSVWIALLICAIPATSLAYFILNWAQKFTTPTKTILILATEPVFSAIFAFWLIGEKMTARDYLGAFLMLIGIIISELNSTSSSDDHSQKQSTSL